MVNFCGNGKWLIRQAIPPGVSGWRGEGVGKNKEESKNQEA